MKPPRLLLFNLMTDESDPLLHFAVGWARGLAAHCEYLDILTMYRGPHQLPGNVRVYSAGRERGLSKAARLARFYRLLRQRLRQRQYDACFAHMMPLFAGLGGPLLRARGIPITLWYAHPQRSAQLRLGMLMSRRVVSAAASSFPYTSDKLRVTGHGIDTDFFVPPARPADDKAETPLLLQVARLSAIKYQTTALRALAGADARLALIGGAPAGASAEYEKSLRDLAAQLQLGGRCRFIGEQNQRQLRAWYQRAAIAINLTPAGSFDKAALESMACALPTVVANPAFAPLLGEYRPLLLTEGPEDVAGLSQRLRHLLALPPAERAAIGAALRENVRRQHSFPRLLERLLAVVMTGELPEEPPQPA